MAKVIFRNFVTKGVIYVRKTALVLLCVLVLGVPVLGQYERTSPLRPEIGPAIARLDKATGWMQMPGGKWVERENRIVKYLRKDYEVLLDYEDYGLGVDNFYWIELREIKIKGEEYYLLLKARRGGQYLYPAIEEDWFDNYQVKGYIFNKENWKAEFKDREPYLLRLELVCEAGLVYYDEPTEEQYIEDMKAKINEVLNKANNGFTYFLNLNILPIDGAARFIFLEESQYKKSVTYSGLFATSRDLPIDVKEVVTPKVFEKFYYETDLEAFRKLFP